MFRTLVVTTIVYVALTPVHSDVDPNDVNSQYVISAFNYGEWALPIGSCNPTDIFGTSYQMAECISETEATIKIYDDDECSTLIYTLDIDTSTQTNQGTYLDFNCNNDADIGYATSQMFLYRCDSTSTQILSVALSVCFLNTDLGYSSSDYYSSIIAYCNNNEATLNWYDSSHQTVATCNDLYQTATFTNDCQYLITLDEIDIYGNLLECVSPDVDSGSMSTPAPSNGGKKGNKDKKNKENKNKEGKKGNKNNRNKWSTDQPTPSPTKNWNKGATTTALPTKRWDRQTTDATYEINNNNNNNNIIDSDGKNKQWKKKWNKGTPSPTPSPTKRWDRETTTTTASPTKRWDRETTSLTDMDDINDDGKNKQWKKKWNKATPSPTPSPTKRWDRQTTTTTASPTKRWDRQTTDAVYEIDNNNIDDEGKNKQWKKKWNKATPSPTPSPTKRWDRQTTTTTASPTKRWDRQTTDAVYEIEDDVIDAEGKNKQWKKQWNKGTPSPTPSPTKRWDRQTTALPTKRWDRETTSLTDMVDDIDDIDDEGKNKNGKKGNKWNKATTPSPTKRWDRETTTTASPTKRWDRQTTASPTKRWDRETTSLAEKSINRYEIVENDMDDDGIDVTNYKNKHLKKKNRWL